MNKNGGVSVKYEKPEMETILLYYADIVRTSGEDEDLGWGEAGDDELGYH